MDGHKPFIAAEEHRDARDAARTGPVADVSPLDSSGLMMQRDDALLLCEHEPDVATEAERATPDYWRNRYNQAAAYARRLREYLRNWQQVAVGQEGRAVVAEAEVADYRDLHLPAAAEGIVCVARRWRDLTLEAERRNAELLQRAERAERRLVALESVRFRINHPGDAESWPLDRIADAIIAAQAQAAQDGGGDQ
jgi:hypothetical protein